MMSSSADPPPQVNFFSTRRVLKIFLVSLLITGILTVFVLVFFPVDLFLGSKQQNNVNSPNKNNVHRESNKALTHLQITSPIVPVPNVDVNNSPSSPNSSVDHKMITLSAVSTGSNSNKPTPRPPPIRPPPSPTRSSSSSGLSNKAKMEQHFQEIQRSRGVVRRNSKPMSRDPTKDFYRSDEGILAKMQLMHRNLSSPGAVPVLVNASAMNSSQNTFYTHNVDWNQFHVKNKVVAFYNLYIGKIDLYPSIVEEQIALMNMTGLLDLLDAVYYVTMGNSADTIPTHIQDLLKTPKPMKSKPSISSEAKRRKLQETHNNKEDKKEAAAVPDATNTSHSSTTATPSSMFIPIRNTAKSVDESLTLSYLYDFCLYHPESIVLYFHNKGSYNYRGENVFFRQFLDCFVLNPQCYDALQNSGGEGGEDYDICGWRLSPVPTPHYSGNYWWAKCSYVNKLVSPIAPYFNDSFAETMTRLPKAIVSTERYFPETWIASYPTVKPADCMDHTIDTTFFCCYNIDHIPLTINVTTNSTAVVDSAITRGANSSIEGCISCQGQTQTTTSRLMCPNHAKQFITNKNDLDDFKVYINKYQPLVKQRLEEVYAQSPGGKISTGSTCKAADAFVNGQYYSAPYEEGRGPVEHYHRIDMTESLRIRSLWWYGQEPVTFLNAVKNLEVLPKLPDQAFIVSHHDVNEIRFFYNKGILYDRSSKECKAALSHNKEQEQARKQSNVIPKVPLYDYLITKLILTTTAPKKSPRQ